MENKEVQGQQTELKQELAYEGIDKFVFCFAAKNYKDSCCFGLFSLRTSIIIFAIIDILVGFINAITLLVFRYLVLVDITKEEFVLLVIDIALIVPAVIGMRGACRTNAKKVSVYYYGKLCQLLTRPTFDLLCERTHCRTRAHECTALTWFLYFIVISLTVVINIYQAYLFYSYVGLIINNQVILANKGLKEAVRVEKYNEQARNIELGIVADAPNIRPEDNI